MEREESPLRLEATTLRCALCLYATSGVRLLPKRLFLSGEASLPSEDAMAAAAKKLEDFNTSNVDCYDQLVEKLCSLVLSGD